jgi:hypothetical protein
MLPENAKMGNLEMEVLGLGVGEASEWPMKPRNMVAAGDDQFGLIGRTPYFPLSLPAFVVAFVPFVPPLSFSHLRIFGQFGRNSVMASCTIEWHQFLPPSAD